jgi:hypothetical protein
MFPAWTFGTIWITSASGPDKRRLWAARGTTFISSWSADHLAARVAKVNISGDAS